MNQKDNHNQPVRLIPKLRHTIRLKHYSYQTEKCYVSWTKRYIYFHKMTHPKELGAGEISAFLTHLAVKRKVSAGTQNQALNAIVFLYRHVLKKNPGIFKDVIRAKRPKILPVVCTPKEVASILNQLDGVYFIMIGLLYGSGLRLKELLQLRIKDIDFERNQIIIRSGKGFKDRITMLPEIVKEKLKLHLKYVFQLHEKDLIEGHGTVYLPYALKRKYPNANKEWIWKYVFPSYKRSIDPRSGIERRHHVYPSVLQKNLKKAAKKASITKRITTHAMRHSFATTALETGSDIRTVQQLLGHKNVKTTMIYTHVLNRGASGTKSPLDRLELDIKNHA